MTVMELETTPATQTTLGYTRVLIGKTEYEICCNTKGTDLLYWAIRRGHWVHRKTQSKYFYKMENIAKHYKQHGAELVFQCARLSLAQAE